MQSLLRTLPRSLSKRTMSTFASTLRTPSLLKHQAFVSNTWVDAASKATFNVHNPATGELLGAVPEMGTVKEVEEVIKVAGEAFKTWKLTTPKQRMDLLMKLFGLMNVHAEDLAKIITAENGKPLADALGETTYSASFIEWFAAEALRTYGDTIPSSLPGLRNVVIKQPVGVVGVLTPWNFPSAMIARKIGPALAAGCTCVIKVPSETPFSALALMELAHQAGFPPGVLNVITTEDAKTVGEVMCESKGVKKISFTGSTGVGKILMKQSASTLKKLSMELGGNAPFIVFDDADLDAAVAGAIICKFRSSGQTLYVQEGVYDEFAKKLVEAVKKFKVGNGAEEGITHGPLIHPRALQKVQSHLDNALSLGATLLAGGKPMPSLGPAFFEPTVIGDVSDDAALMDEETFGPLGALVKFKTEEEVIERANNTDVGLAGYFFSRDVGRVWRVAEALEVGMVGSNTGLISQAVIPFGGVKESGFGREGSKYGIDDYMITKFIAFGGLNA